MDKRAEIAAQDMRVVLVFQGGGALGAYQAGCYEALHHAGIRPDWVIGTSIGAINAAVIAGNAPEERLEKLKLLWQRLSFRPMVAASASLLFIGQNLANMMTAAYGLEGFFAPNPLAFASSLLHLGAERAGYYDTSQLRRTLADLVDFSRIDRHETRMTVGAARVRDGEMVYFDSQKCRFGMDHVMASGALPPAFPAVRIDGELYWDGGILSNTPVEAVFDDNPRRSSLVFAVHVWNADGTEPQSIAQVMSRQKDVQYASRAYSHIARQQQLHRLRHVIAELAAALPADQRDDPHLRELAAYGCVTRMHVMRLLAPRIGADDAAKDIDFSPTSIKARWQAGLRDTEAVLAAAPWRKPVDPLAGFVLHQLQPDGAILSR